MLPRDVRELAKLLEVSGLPVRVDEYGTLFIEQGPISAFITQRPYYCDRGRWLVHAESLQPHKLCIDHADGFPRYYFFTDCLVREFGHWFTLRLGQVRDDRENTGTVQELGSVQEPE